MSGTNSAVVALVAFFLAVGAAITTGLGWWAINNYADVCTGEPFTYVRAVTITATIELAVSLFFILFAFLNVIFDSLDTAFQLVTAVVGGTLLIASSVLGFVFFVWGIITLSGPDNCQGTPFFGLSIWFVVAGGLGLLRAIFKK